MDLVVSDHPLHDTDRQARRPLVAGLAGLLLGAGAAAGLMFLLDPVSGRRRRAQLRERLARVGSGGAEEQLEARVREHLASLGSHAAAVEVSVEAGCVTLRGTVPAEELDDLLDEVCGLAGVHEVHNLLQVQLQAPQPPGQH